MGTLVGLLNYLTTVNKAQTPYHKLMALLWYYVTHPNGRLFSNKNSLSLKRPWVQQLVDRLSPEYFRFDITSAVLKVSHTSSLVRSLFLRKTAVKTFSKAEVTICARLEILSSEPLLFLFSGLMNVEFSIKEFNESIFFKYSAIF